MIPTRMLTLLASVALVASPLVAQIVPADVAVSNGPLGGSAVSVLVDPLDSDVVLVTKDGNNPGLWRSTDRGVSFDPFGTGLPDVVYPLVTDLTVDPANPSTIYALFDTTIFKSTDFGATWSALPFVPERKLKALSLASSGGGMLAIDAFNVYHSPDNGATWSIAHSVVPFSGNVIDCVGYAPSDSSIAYVSGSSLGMVRSNDGGASFTSTGSFDDWAQTLTVHPTDADTVFVGTPFDGLQRSTNAGATFIQVAQDLTPTFNGEFFKWELDGSALWYAVLDGLFRSTDNGDSWTLVHDGMSASFTPIPLDMALASNGDRYLGQSGGGLYDSSGGGLYRMAAGTSTWEHLGFLEALINDVAIAGPGGTRVVGIGSGVYAAGVGEPVTPTAWHADIGTDTRSVAVDPDDPDRWITGGVGAFFDNGRIIAVTNEGQDFEIVFDPGVSGGGIVYDIEFSPDDSDRVVAGFYPGAFGWKSIMTSTDSGNTWIPIDNTVGWATVALSFNPFVVGHVVQLSENNQWSQSFNGGLDWQAIKPAWPGGGFAMLLEFDPFVPNRLYRGDASGLWRSDDAGTTWNSLGVPLHAHSSLEFHPEFPGMLWVGDDEGRVLISGDHGDSFTVAWQVPLNANAAPMAIDTADGTLVVGTTLASMWEVPGGSPVVKLAGATKGTGDFVPQLGLGGGLPQLGNAGFSLTGDDILGGALVYMALGFTQQPLFVFGGVFQIDSPIWRLYAAGGAPGVGGAGSFVAPFPLPANPVLMDVEIFAQLAVPDTGTMNPSQVALSNALSITFHN